MWRNGESANNNAVIVVSLNCIIIIINDNARVARTSAAVCGN